MFHNFTPLHLIRQKVSTSVPLIFTSNWKSEYTNGWRWDINLELVTTEDVAHAEETLTDYQLKFGKKRVSVGHSFDEDAMKPMPHAKMVGLYVRDVEEQIEEFVKELESIEDFI